MSPVPQLVEDGQENSGISTPDWRRPARSFMAGDRACKAPQDAIGPVVKLRLGHEQAQYESYLILSLLVSEAQCDDATDRPPRRDAALVPTHEFSPQPPAPPSLAPPRPARPGP